MNDNEKVLSEENDSKISLNEQNTLEKDENLDLLTSIVSKSVEIVSKDLSVKTTDNSKSNVFQKDKEVV